MPVYPNFYQPYQTYQPYTQYQIPQTQQQTQNGIIWVQGEAGAKSYLTTAGQSVLLMDSEKNSFYIKLIDPSGMPLPLRIFDYTERNTMQTAQEVQNFPVSDMTNYITRQEFEEKISQLLSQKGDAENAKSDI